MPDWSYGPLFKPLLFRLPAERARDLTLGSIGRLGRAPGGASVIAALGHMQAPAPLRRQTGFRRCRSRDFVDRSKQRRRENHRQHPRHRRR